MAPRLDTPTTSSDADFAWTSRPVKVDAGTAMHRFGLGRTQATANLRALVARRAG